MSNSDNKYDWAKMLGLETKDEDVKQLFNLLVGGFPEPKKTTKVSNWDE